MKIVNTDKYFAQSINQTDMIALDPTYIPDANFLLSAYQWRYVTVKEVQNSLEEVHKKGKLQIPLQVIREFTKNRPNIIQNKINDIEMQLNNLKTIKKLENIVPILENTKEFNSTEKLIKSHEEQTKKLRKKLKEIQNDLGKLFYKDPYFDFIKELSSSCTFISGEEKSVEDIRKEATTRFSKKIPPGYKDSGKDSNSEGDYIIWHDIISLKENVVFVSAETKPDWVYTEKDNKILGPKVELLQEYFEKTEGKYFYHMNPKDFITSLNPKIEGSVKEDLLKYIPIEENLKNYSLKYYSSLFPSKDDIKVEILKNMKLNSNSINPNNDYFLIISTVKSIENSESQNRLISKLLDYEIEFNFKHQLGHNPYYSLIKFTSPNPFDDALISFVVNVIKETLGEDLIEIKF
ncbi:PIN-like domain-containing protein [Carnobacterium maltaromaticum]|uniref:PIN-like domain-containing protein n=1 Tax=Carnobacterium maltaromaticum TaxID=2751 RepID=UPI00298AB716|nr:PIN-like domain-containing protein [Carnobacterium maltaromaticum]MDW5525044.1 PIN-like domain-containing protein [Carnobacterium maltaromaticum]